MSWYAKIPRLNGRKDYVKLMIWLQRNMIIEVHYNRGGWADTSMHNVHPHLIFDLEEDAIAYVLAKGGTYGTEIPTEKE